MSVEFKEIPENMSEIALMFKVYNWAAKEKITFNNVNHFIDTLYSKAKKYRSDRKELSINEFKKIVEEHSTETLDVEIIKATFENKFIKSSEILSVLGITQNDILKASFYLGFVIKRTINAIDSSNTLEILEF
ncbi:hypothetical protein [Oceanobacillus neutriphilus]|uniref:hypothetical protein n=1 Tax=Oceanobacillus neutriphilus TaxID=531815 RepID=UPI001E3ACCCF|nr:hypothetical protein [Oceanobacillus neutriphilus]